MNPAGDQPDQPDLPSGAPPLSQPTVAHVSVRLPPFWSRNPAIWFHQVEAQFLLAGVTSQLARYRHVVAALPPEIAMDVADVITSQPPQSPYDHLRAAILKRTMLSERKRIKQLLSAEELGDRRPSQLLRAMQALLADRADSIDEAFLRELFLQRLPTTVQMVLATAETLPLFQLAEHPDKVLEVAVPGALVGAVNQTAPPYAPPSGTLGHPSPSASPSAISAISVELASVRAEMQRLSESVAALQRPSPRRRSSSRSRRYRSPRRFNSRSPSPTDGTTPPPCWYHERFGSAATRCTRPCGWSGNDQGNR
ncbi:uncharacterized protein LOC135384072 [Ornithodoros turicata]|uniref:uncharacterized protein LOC135384072 n=1 Tax=Ornithodoros turicata TaxID=34597 RepID=UPI003139F0A4